MSVTAPEAEVRGPLPDGSLLVFLSDTHIGGARGSDIFESADQLLALFEELGRHDGTVELVLAGDIFDLQRMDDDAPDRIAATIALPEYRELFEELRRFAVGPGHRVVYVIGNHDAELWWNQELRRSLVESGLVHEVVLSYATAFASAPDRLIYCEHGNQLDPANRIIDYANPLETPMGAHVVTEFVRPIGSGAAVTESLDLRELSYVFPIGEIPEWISGRIFYQFLSQAVRWLLTPLIILGLLVVLIRPGGDAMSTFERILVGVAFDLAVIVVAIGVLASLGARMARQAVAVVATTPFGQAITAKRYEADEAVRELLGAGEPPPTAGNLHSGDIAVWVSGHTHGPSMSDARGPDGGTTVVVNTGCWLRQLRPLKARLGAPSVFVPVFVQTHVRVRAEEADLNVELWEHPRAVDRRFRWIDPLRIIPKGPKPIDRRLQWIERLAIADRLPENPPSTGQRMVAHRRA
jgi:Calcineurin-like phosphoesterase